jgi:N-acetyl-anhydromuramyl-L-alanine amidase AmpD
MKKITGIVAHYISAVNVLPDDPFNPEAIRKIFTDNKVSAHYQITRDAKILELVTLPLKAYHAGYSIMNGVERCNDFCIGIEIEGGKDFEFLPDQMALFKHLSANLMAHSGSR